MFSTDVNEIYYNIVSTNSYVAKQNRNKLDFVASLKDTLLWNN